MESMAVLIAGCEVEKWAWVREITFTKLDSEGK